MSAETRAGLAEQQQHLLSALSGQVPSKSEFDRDRLEACGEALLRKRARAAARVWPQMEQMLGEENFRERYLQFARTTPLVEEGGPLADGYAFVRSLDSAIPWSDEAKLERLAVEMRYRWNHRGLRPRRGVALQWVHLRQRRKLVLALRLPWWGVKWVMV